VPLVLEDSGRGGRLRLRAGRDPLSSGDQIRTFAGHRRQLINKLTCARTNGEPKHEARVGQPSMRRWRLKPSII